MEPEKNMPPVEVSETLFETSTGINPSEGNGKHSDHADKICRTLSVTSFSSSSASTEVKDFKTVSKDLHGAYSSQASDISLDLPQGASMNQALKSEKAFIAYVMSLPPASTNKESPKTTKAVIPVSIKSKCKPSFISTTATNATKVGLDHLDNLCKLMEQLSELRDTNTKLQKRVQYLEDLKTLHEMHKEIRRGVQYGSENVLTQRGHLGLKKSLTSADYVQGFPRGSEDYARYSPREKDEYFYRDGRRGKNTRSPSDRRGRVASHPPYDGHRRERSKSVGHEEGYDGKPKRIFSKWSKVKEALGWESERKNSGKSNKLYFGPGSMHSSGGEQFLVGNRRIFSEQDSAALRIPLYCDYSEKDEISPIDTYAGEAMAAAAEGIIPPFNSSAEDISVLFDSYRTSSHLKPKSLTIERDIDTEQAFSKFEKEEAKKCHKSPWGRVKTIIERRRDSLKRRHLRRGPSSSTSRYPSNLEDIDYELQDSCYDSPRKSSDEQLIQNPSLSKVESRFLDDSEKSTKRKNVGQTTLSKESDSTRQALSSSQSSHAIRTDIDCRASSLQDREVMFRTPCSSPQLHRKSTWMKMKNALRSKKEGDATSALSQSMPSSPNGVHDGTFDFENTEIPEDNSEETDCFKPGHEITRVGSDSYVHKLSLSASAPVSDIMLKLQHNISDDFSRKMQEWEQIRNAGIRPTLSPKWERKNSNSKSRKKSDKTKFERFEKSPKPKLKDLTWLEKELQKIEKEKQRLSREKEKYEERAVRLERLRQTVLTTRNSYKKEVLVRTSAGEFRFEGISDAFTKKLYEWETKRGLGPELSTIALLDSSLGSSNKNCLTIHQMEKCGNLQRGLSRSESSLAEIGQPSHTSSNSLPSLKPPDIADLEKIHHHSRANSEPDLSFVGMSSNPSCERNSFGEINDLTTESSRDTLGATPRESYGHPGVTRLIDSDVEESLCEIESDRQEQRDENYYSLLEENVILLEQLKNKEEICRRLEKELELLDEKVEEMNKHHLQEMERYREKLWEMHKPGSTPREVQGCLQVMVHLRSRIENLEKCSEKLKNEKETLEDSFRFHSAEQEHMTLDLLDKMRELHAAGGDTKKKEEPKEYSQTSFDIKIVERLQELSSQLVKQTHELEQALAERTRQICQLRWELLHRDVSSVKLETELHSAQMQGTNPQNRSICDEKRSKYAHFRSWSSEEASNRSRKLQECSPQAQRRPKVRELQEEYYKLPKTEFQTTKLSNTVHELNRELIRLSTAAESFLSSDGAKKGEAKEKSEWNIEDDFNDNILHQQSGADASMTLSCQNEMRISKISVRRNSAGSVSITSGVDPGGSESSSVNDDNNQNVSIPKSSPKLYRKFSNKNLWSDSESSTEEESFTKVTFHSRPADRPGAALWNADREGFPKQPVVKRKAYHEYEDDKNQTGNRTNEQGDQGLKKKNSHKLMKNSKKMSSRHSQFSNEPDASQWRCSAQNETDAILNQACAYARGIPVTKPTSNKMLGITASKNNSFFVSKSNQSIDQIASKSAMQLKSEFSSKKGIPKKDSVNHLYKSHSIRTAASDSKIPKCNRVNIRKSESCHEGKRSGDTNVKHDDNFLPAKISESNRSKSGSIKKKSNKSEARSTNIVPNVKQKLNFTQSEMKGGHEYHTLQNTGKLIGEKNNTHENVTKTNEPKSLKLFDVEVMPQISVKRKQFALQQQNLFSCENKTKQESLDDSDENFENEEENNSLRIRKYDGSDKKSISAPTTTFVLTLPKSRSKVSPSIDESSSEQQSNSSEKDSRLTIEENTVTVVIPKRKQSKVALKNKGSNVLQPKSNQENNVIDITNYETVPSRFDLPTSCSQNDTKEPKNSETAKKTLNDDYRTFDYDSTGNVHHYADVDSVNPCVPTISGNSKYIKMHSEKSQNPFFQIFDNSNADQVTSSSHGNFLDSSNDKFVEKIPPKSEEKCSNYLKSPSAPQLDWKKSCAKKISKEGAPNVKTLIEKYNQKVLETQSPKSPCSSNYNSPAITRKISAPPEETEFHVKGIPFSSTPSTPRIITAASFYNPLTFKPTNLNLFPSPAASPPTSPSSKARSEALLKAKENFISSSSIFTITAENFPTSDDPEDRNWAVKSSLPDSEQKNSISTKRSATDSEINKLQNLRTVTRKSRAGAEDTNRRSICSNKSTDSMSMVLCKTGETCQESRLTRKFDKQKIDKQSKSPDTNFKTSKSLSNSSIFKAVIGYDLRLPSSFLRLRRSRKKKDMSTVNELCRQSLLLSGEGSSFAQDDNVMAKSARSCPSSPELKPKSKSKPSWFQRGLFKLK